MRLVHVSAIAVAAALLIPAGLGAQDQDADRKVAGGGIMIDGWMGKITQPARGGAIEDSKLETMGSGMHATIGPAAIYWNPANTASGDFTVKATFKEKTDMEHPHPAGVFIGGSNLEGDQQKFVYCTVYGTGDFLVRQFDGTETTAPAAKQAHDAVHKPAADGFATNEVAWRVSGSRAECVVNGTVVAGFAKSDIVGTDGIFGLRFSHNMDAHVSDFGKGMN